jgi:hypothetical protein
LERDIKRKCAYRVNAPKRVRRRRIMTKIQKVILIVGAIILLICIIDMPQYWSKDGYVRYDKPGLLGSTLGFQHHYDWGAFLIEFLIIGIATTIAFFGSKWFLKH